MSWRRRVLPLIALSTVAVSCGGGAGVFDTAPATSPSRIHDVIPAEALSAGEALVAHLGPEPALLAVGFALDRGYAAGQIAAAAPARVLQPDGTINGAAPELPPWGIFSDLPVAGGSATGGGSRTIAALTNRAGGPNPYEVQITRDQWVAGLAAEADRVFSGLATPSSPSSGGSTTTTTEPPAPDEGERATIMIGLIVDLSNLGYSAEQIILGIALGEARIAVVPTGQGPIGCWLLQDSARGGVIAPAGPPLPGALAFDGACRAAIDRLAPPDGEGSTSTTTTTTSTTTSTTPDADGIADGIYTGEVRLVADVGAPVYELSDTLTELEVTDDAVRATVEFTARVSIRVRGIEPVCIATTRRTYFGQGFPASSIELVMEPQDQEIVSLEGPECGVVAGSWPTTAEEDLLAEFAQETPFTLAGSFGPRTFEGTIANVLGVTAALDG